jgi:hypothetical protein
MLKSVLGSMFVVSLFSWPLLSWSNEMPEIEKVIGNYFEGYQNANTELIKSAFHQDTRLLSVDEGKLDVTEMKDWLVNLEDRQQRGDIRKGKLIIKSIDVKDYTAMAKLEIQFEKFIFTDYLSLLQIDGKWMIVGKIYHFQNR